MPGLDALVFPLQTVIQLEIVWFRI